MGLRIIDIARGIRLNYLECDKFKTNLLSVNLIAPLEREHAGARALIPNILMRGCKSMPTMADINKKLEYLYASSVGARNHKRGELQVFGLVAEMIDSAYTFGNENLTLEVCDIVTELLLDPVCAGGAFDADYTESEKSNLVDLINSNINNKAYYARERLICEMCRDEAFGASELGTVESVSALTPDGVYNEYKYALCHFPIEIFFVGKCDIDRLSDKLADKLGSLPRDVIALPKTEVRRTAGEIRSVTEDMPVNQGKLTIGMRSGITLHDPDFPALLMFNAMFGGEVTSKLFMNVREKMSLCYYCSSSPDAVKGLIIIQSGIESDKFEVAKNAIFDQLEDIRAGRFTDDEQSSALRSLSNGYRELSDSARQLESWYLGRRLAGAGGDPEDIIDSLSRVTRDEIIAAANKASVDTIYFLNGTLKEEEENA